MIDNSRERNDGQRILAVTPEITFLENGVRDAGHKMPDEWFHRGVAFALEALSRDGTAVLAYCHVGVNRGPSMTFAILLALG